MQLDALFSPKSIAVIGASTTEGTVGYTLTENLLKNGYTGKVYPINPKTDTLFNIPCYKNVADIDDDIDLAIIIIRADVVPQALREAGKKGVRATIIISSGFKEIGNEGKSLEDEVTAIAKKYDIALLGPNCLGFLNPSLGLNASFAKNLPQGGEIAFFSQSGALCTALLDISANNLGFSYFVSIGNKAVIKENELLDFFAQKKETKLLGFYTEGLQNAKELIKIGRALSASDSAKPIISLKAGTTSAGAQASGSHTGALAGSDVAYEALFKQARIVRAENLEHLLELFSVFSKNNLPKGKRVGIITNAGGLGVLATDSAVAHELEIAKLSPETKNKLSLLPPAASINNPVDVLGDALADRYRLAIDTLIADDNVDMLLIIVTPQTMTQPKEIAEIIVEAKKHSSKPIVAIYAGQESLAEGLSILQKNNVAVLLYPESGARALAALAQVSEWRKNIPVTAFTFNDIQRETAKAIITQAKAAGRTTLSPKETENILRTYGFPMLESYIAENKEEALAIARKINKPLVMKIVSPDIIHKSDVGGVLLGVKPKEIADAFEKLLAQVKTHLPNARIEGVLIEEMIEQNNGQEIILGLKKEPGLGTLVLAGLGGIFVETFNDTAIRFAPMFQEDAKEMLSELKSFPILAGARGQKGIDLKMFATLIGRLSQLATDFPEISELDINPLLAFPEPENFHILDARISLEK
jgi:acetyltransferase